MPQFFYKAKNGPKDAVTGYIQAESIAQAVSKLMQAGEVPLEIRPREALAEKSVLARDGNALKVPPAALGQFTRQMADLLGAGIPLLRCMDLYSRQKQFPVMNTMTAQMMISLQQGASLSLALARHPSVFSPLYINIVKAGEATGHLPMVLERLAKFLEQDQKLKSQARSSLLYPAMILCVGLMTIFVLLSFVLPRLTLLFEDFDAQLPWPTQAVIGLSQFFAQFWWLIAILAVGAFLGCRSYLATDAGRLRRDTLVLKVPLLRSFIENVQLSRLSHTLGVLLESGVPVVSALELSIAVVDNLVLQKEVRLVAFRVKEGMSLTQAIKASSFFPEVAVDLVAVGQESGRLESGLYKLAENSGHLAQEFSQTFITILGPAVLVVVVGFVGAMIVAVLLPMFQLNSIIH